VDWHASQIRLVLRTGLACAWIAEALARRLKRIDPERAWAAGLLTPLGWYAACALDPDAAAACLADPSLAADPVGTQRRHWSADDGVLARRVARRWGLPDWLTAVVGRLGLPAGAAADLGADADLFRLTRLAAGLARERGLDLGQEAGDADAAALGLSPEDLARLELPPAPPETAWQDPRQVPLLRDLLTVAAENRRLREGALRRRAEVETDRLHDALERQARGEAERLRAGKLAAMAEFAAGAGHEINNPLAVISGQAQYVLGHAARWFSAEAGDTPRKSLQTIIAQSNRIHGLLRDLMQFSRPPAPRPRWFDLAELLGESAAALRDLAEHRRVRLDIQAGTGRTRVHADRDQVKTALTNLVRNAVEAAPAEGWTRAVLSAPADGCVAVVVEDSGPGPDRSQWDHLFDPFWSGRSAGRGRGLGLPTAWRLARLQGGDVCFEPPSADGPTRFVLQLPWAPCPESESGATVNGVALTVALAACGLAAAPAPPQPTRHDVIAAEAER
jgi:signal transduction histidine kinase